MTQVLAELQDMEGAELVDALEQRFVTEIAAVETPLRTFSILRPRNSDDLIRDQNADIHVQNRCKERRTNCNAESIIVPRKVGGVPNSQIRRGQDLFRTFDSQRIDVDPMQIRSTHAPGNEIRKPATHATSNFQTGVTRSRKNARRA